MKKSMLCAGLMTIVCAAVFAEDNDSSVNPNTSAMQSTLATANPAIESEGDQGMQVAATAEEVPALALAAAPTPATTPSTIPVDNSATTPAGTNNVSPATEPTPQGGVTPSTSDSAAPAATLQKLDCNYRIPAETTHIDQAVVIKWTENAAEQSFNFNYNDIKNQLTHLQACFTDQGWQGFNDALQKSGNLNAIQTQKLIVSSMVNGEAKFTEIKENQWKVSLPMQVIYQNDNEKLTQPLTINLVIGRKISGDLGIMQIIAIPRQTTMPNTTENNPQAPAAVTQPTAVQP